jgi:hypothetical protein
LTLNCDLDLEVSVMKAVRDTPSSDGACVYEVSSNYVERSKTYGPDKQNVDARTHARPPIKRHTIIRPVFDGRIIKRARSCAGPKINYCLFPLYLRTRKKAPTIY